MKTRIYLGDKVEITAINTKKIEITFITGATIDDKLQFDYFPFWPEASNTPRLSIFKTSRVFAGEVTINSNPTQQAINYVTAFNLDFNSLGQFTVTRVDNIVTITATNNSDLINGISAGSTFVTLVNPVETTLEDDYKLLDLFEDENIEVTSKLSDIEKLSNVFLDFSNSFSVPATAKNSELFKHYYDVDIDNTFNANIRINGYIEIDSFPFRFGKIQLEGIKLKNQKPDSYKITFYGGAKQLTDLFGDDTINKLDYNKNSVGVTDREPTWNSLSKYAFEYNGGNFINSINLPSFKDGNIITPLIAYTDRDWNYGTNDLYDIANDTLPSDGDIFTAIKDTELRPAIRLSAILEAIEVKYNVSISRQFFGSATFNNLFMWMNANNIITDPRIYFLLDTFIENDSSLYYSNVSIDDNIFSFTDNGYNYEEGNNYNLTPYIFNLRYKNGDDATGLRLTFQILDENNNVLQEEIKVVSNPISISSNYFIQQSNGIPIDYKFKIRIICNEDIYYDSTEVILANNFGSGPYDTVIVGGDTNLIVSPEVLLPNLKVTDFLLGIMKMFKLIIRPLSSNQFYINTIDGYYSEGNILNVSEFIDNEQIKVDRPEIYKEIFFNYQKTNNILGKKFRQTYDFTNDEIGYGDLKSIYSNIDSKNELKVNLPFENMLFEKMSDFNTGEFIPITIGQSISTNDDSKTFTKNNSKPILFFNNGINSHSDSQFQFKFNTDDSIPVSYSYNIGNTNDELLDQVTDTINWGAEVDPWHNKIVANSLYLNYWSNWVNTIYDLRQRKFTYEGYLPPRYIEELSLNDRLIIGNNRYKINDYKINLLDGKTQLTLFNDIFDWNPFSFPSDFIFNERSFSPNGWFMTDTIDNGDSAYIYGSFTGYNSTAYGRIVKLLPNGDVDTSFNTGTGFNNNSFGFQSITKQADGKLVVTGNFTSFNGTARNRIARLNTDGSLDTSLVVGTGFNNITSGVEVDSQGRIVVCGSYSSYSGVSANRIIRLLSGGTVDTSFVYGTAFNNVTNSVVINSDDSMYVGGYFSTYSGITSNRIIKLTAGGTVDTSFNVGTGLNSNTSNQPVGLISDGDGGVYVFGYFTTYSGITANRLTKLLPTGQIDPNFNIGNGFNGPVITAYKVLNDKLLISGTFTSFNGLTVSNGIIVLNSDGSIYRTFSGNYNNIFTIGNRFYGNLNNGVTELIDDESLPTISPQTIIANAGTKYYGINILKNFNWSVTKIDLGYGTDWIDITTPSGTRATEVVIRIEEKASQSAPQVYQPRYMILRFNFDGIYREVTIVQNGLT
jgi:hypothetical protein